MGRERRNDGSCEGTKEERRYGEEEKNREREFQWKHFCSLIICTSMIRAQSKQNHTQHYAVQYYSVQSSTVQNRTVSTLQCIALLTLWVSPESLFCFQVRTPRSSSRLASPRQREWTLGRSIELQLHRKLFDLRKKGDESGGEKRDRKWDNKKGVE